MGFEVDILEREEHYKRRVNRTLVLIATVVGVALTVGFFLLNRQEKKTLAAEAQAAESARLAEIARARAAFSADSASAVNRLADFKSKYEIEEVPGAPLFAITLPSGKSVARFLEEMWHDYTQAAEPGASEQREYELFRLHYVDVMNRAWRNPAGRVVWQGETRPSAVLVPELKHKVTRLDILKTTFPQIVRAQEAAGIRVLQEEQLDVQAAAVTDTTDAAAADAATDAAAAVTP